MAKLDVNDHLVVVGNFGRYQWLNLLLTGLMVMLFGMQMFVSIFTHATPSFRCVHNQTSSSAAESLANSTYYDDSCSFNVSKGNVYHTAKCDTFEYDLSMFTSTIVTDFDLVCDRKHYVTIVNMAWMASEGVGAILGSYISDRFGRKPMIIVTYLLIGIFGTITAFATNLIMYTMVRCTMGFVCFAGFSSAITLLMESMSPYKRSQAINAVDLFWVLGYGSLSLWAFYLTDWKYLQLAISVTGLPLGLACIWLLDESPHWLMMNGKREQAIHVLNKMARWNRVVAPNLEVEKSDLLMDDKKLPETSAKVKQISSNSRESCCEIWKYKRVVVRFLVFSAGWVSCAFCYYALSFGVTKLPGNLYLNSFIMAAVEGLAYAVCFIIAVIGRKWLTVGSYLAGGISLLISIVIQLLAAEAEIAVTVLSVIGKFWISAAWQIIFVWQTEVYPTTQRVMLIALNGVIGRIGTVLVPYMIDLHLYIDLPNEEIILPSIFVVLMVSVGLLHIIPPETNNRRVPSNLWEANQPSFPLMGEEEAISDVEDDVLLAESELIST